MSILTNDSQKSMGRFRIQILLDDNTWTNQYNIPKNDRYSDLLTNWTRLILNFTVGNFGIKLFFFDQIDTAHADMGFNNIRIAFCILKGLCKHLYNCVYISSITTHILNG